MFGLGITGMNNSTSWGLYLTCFMFFVGLFGRRPHRGLVGLYLRH